MPICKPDLSFFPAIQRRRLNTSARLMFQSVSELLAESHTHDYPIITVSRDGEVVRNFELWLNLIKHHEISPTS